jgi:hypothetical protein
MDSVKKTKSEFYLRFIENCVFTLEKTYERIKNYEYETY